MAEAINTRNPRARQRRIERKCRTCKFWGKPSSKQARADYAFPCHAPLPIADWPRSFVGQLDKRPMERDEGQDCPAWEVIF